jgi:hypothetical protein
MTAERPDQHDDDTPYKPSDAAYHRIYSDPRMVEDMMRQFVPYEWVNKLDFPRMRRINAKFHIRGFPRREGDVIWAIPMLDIELVLYLILLLEFQSNIDRFMVLRTGAYKLLTLMQLKDEGEIPPDGKLPPTFTIVLYNGDSRWTQPTCLRDLIALPADSILWPYQPSEQFFLLDEGAIPKGELKQKADSPSAMLYRIEHAESVEELQEASSQLALYLNRHDELAALREALVAMINAAIRRNDAEDSIGLLDETAKILEVPIMLATRIQSWMEQARADKADALREALQEGEQRGKLETTFSTLLLLLRNKFGTVPQEIESRIRYADVPSMQHWMIRLLTANSLEEVFQG